MSYSKKKGNLGKVYRAETKYIDKDTKKHRNYVVVKEVGNNVGVSKLKSIKKFDDNDKNIDLFLQEINATRYGLKKRTGVDSQVFERNRITGKKLTLKDKRVFSEKEEFTLGSHDWSRVQSHLRKRYKKRDKN